MDYLKLIQTHFDTMLNLPENIKNKMWTSQFEVSGKSLSATVPRDIVNATIPKGCELLPGKRAYRYIDAPNGSSLYWDQPLIVSAYLLGKYINKDVYIRKANEYIEFFFEKCIAKNGAFLWGNHYYYDFEKDSTVYFSGSEIPRICDENENGSLHEMRPFAPAWDILWDISSEKTEQHIKFMADNHFFDNEGGFNRHADKKKSCAFLEAGGVIAESLCWLYSKTLDASLLEKALKIVNYSWENRNKETNLAENNPTVDRWDKYTITSEIGLWGNSLIRMSEYSGEKKFIEIAAEAVGTYLKYAYDEKTGKYYGRLNVSDGLPCLEERTTLYQPGLYSDAWEFVFPSHDYLASLALCSVKLYRLTGEDRFLTAVNNFADITEKSIPNEKQIVYAEQLGRMLLFLIETGNEKCKVIAHKLAKTAVERLWCENIFRSSNTGNICSAVDGLGFLFLGMIYLQKGETLDCLGLGL